MRGDCPDCSTALSGIRLLVAGSGVGEVTKYTAVETKPKWTGSYPSLGAIHAQMCPDCGRILLYAELPADAVPLPSSYPLPNESALPRALGAGTEEAGDHSKTNADSQ
jgi:hypothetical protein